MSAVRRIATIAAFVAIAFLVHFAATGGLWFIAQSAFLILGLTFLTVAVMRVSRDPVVLGVDEGGGERWLVHFLSVLFGAAAMIAVAGFALGWANVVEGNTATKIMIGSALTVAIAGAVSVVLGFRLTAGRSRRFALGFGFSAIAMGLLATWAWSFFL